MNSTFNSLAIFLLVALRGGAVCAQEGTVSALPYVMEIAFVDAGGLEIPTQRLELTSQSGWLVVTLTSNPEKLEWRIVLAKIIPDSMPVVTVHPELPLFSVQYGPWFIRESLERLRVYREPKGLDNDSWKQIVETPRGKVPCAAGRLFVVREDDWYWVCTSPKYDKKSIDTRIRFQHGKLGKGHGSMVLADGNLAEVFYGDARCQDEGDLLIATRMNGYIARAMIANTEIKKSLVGSAMPPIVGRTIGDTVLPNIAELRGKVVLVDFWATWCGPCVKKLPEVNVLQKRFGMRGLVVIGVHANQNSEDLTSFVDGHEFEFPVVLSDKETERRFGVSQFPSYFLVGRDGKVVSASLSDPPSDTQIETELAKTDEPSDATESASRGVSPMADQPRRPGDR